GRMTPIRLIVSGVEHPFSGSFRITEEIGNTWRGEASSLIEIPIPLVSNGEYEQLLPLYDFTHPLKVVLCSSDAPVANAEVSLRDLRQESAFPLLVGAFPTLIDPEAVTVAPSDLPSHWLAYDGVKSLWVGRTQAGLSRAQWEAIARWTLAGGTIVLFSGADFYPLDSPVLRELIPLSNPSLTLGEEGIRILSGEARSGSRAINGRADGRTLLFVWSYGAGTVLLVPVSVFDLTAEEGAAVSAAVPPAQMVSLSGLNAYLLEEIPVNRPGFSAVLLVVVLSLLGLTLITSKVRSPKSIVLSLAVVTGVLSVSSGLYLNQAKLVNDIYTLNTALYVEGSFGYWIDWYGLFANRATDVRFGEEGAFPIMEVLPRDLRDADYDIGWVKGESLSLQLVPGERRTLRGGETYTIPITVHYVGDEEVEIENGLSAPLSEAYLLVDGQTFLLGEIGVGTWSYTLGAASVRVRFHDASLAAFYDTIETRYSAENGVWLVGGRVSDTIVVQNGVRQKVRVVSLYLLAGGEDE
ncbi:MAG: hypothetical protein U9R21_07770, partial [Candidatus Thermoplasmatota archaeon]|nr:hypothetical protein [Candidatus Thermoplasmatota archaeon]